MKRLVLIPLVLVFLIPGCGQIREYIANVDENKVILISAKITAREIGCEVAFSEDPEIDRAVRNVYDLAKAGELTQDAMDQLNDAL